MITKKVFIIERSPDVFQTVRSYLKEDDLPFDAFSSVRDTVESGEMPAVIILIGSNDFSEIRRDVSDIKNTPAFTRLPKVLILPFNASITETEVSMLDVQAVFTIPIEKLKFQTSLSKFLNRSPRRVFRILVSIQQAGSNVRYSGLSIDFSESGMAFECVSDFSVGEIIHVSFVNPRNRNRFALKAEVVRRTSTLSGSAIFYGIMFRELSAKDCQALTNFITGA